MTDERLLIDRARQGDVKAFGELVERSKANVYRLARDLTGSSSDAEDLSQDVFMKAYRSLNRFRGDARWNTWLYRITVNACYDHHRSPGRRLEFRDSMEGDEMSDGPIAHSNSPAPDQAAEGGVIQQHIEQALTDLSPQERAVFVMRHYHDMPLKEIAGALEVAEGSVKSALFRAIRRLQRSLAFYRPDLGLEEKS